MVVQDGRYASRLDSRNQGKKEKENGFDFDFDFLQCTLKYTVAAKIVAFFQGHPD